jgi:hypothetical protein
METTSDALCPMLWIHYFTLSNIGRACCQRFSQSAEIQLFFSLAFRDEVDVLTGPDELPAWLQYPCSTELTIRPSETSFSPVNLL